MFSKRVALLKKGAIICFGFGIKWDGVTCLMPAHTKVFAFLRLLNSLSFFFAKSSIMYLSAGWEGRTGKYLARRQGLRIDFFISTSTYQICMNTNIKELSTVKEEVERAKYSELIIWP